MQMTGGSTSTWSEFDRYRQAGAAARAMLVQAAAAALQRAGRPTAHRERRGDRRRRSALRYGELADAAGKLQAPDPAR